MEGKIKTYKTIGEFFDELTKLKPERSIEFIGKLSILDETKPGTPPRFDFGSNYESEIEFELTNNFSKELFNQYRIRWREKEEIRLLGMWVSIDKDHWEAQYHYDGAHSRVKGPLVNFGFVLYLEPKLRGYQNENSKLQAGSQGIYC